MALSKQLSQAQFLLLSWVRYVRRRYLAFGALIFGSLLLTSLLVSIRNVCNQPK